MSEPIFSSLSGKTATFPNGFTVSGWTGPYSVYNGNYTYNGSDAFLKGGDVFYFAGDWVFNGTDSSGSPCAETNFSSPCCCNVVFANTTGGGDINNFPITGWTAQKSQYDSENASAGGTLSFAAL